MPTASAGIVPLRIAEPAGFVDFAPAQAKVCGGGRFGVVVCNAKILRSVSGGNLAPLLRSVVFLCQAHFNLSVKFLLWDIGKAGGLNLLVLGHARIAGGTSPRLNISMVALTNVLVCAMSRLNLLQQLPRPTNRPRLEQCSFRRYVGRMFRHWNTDLTLGLLGLAGIVASLLHPPVWAYVWPVLALIIFHGYVVGIIGQLRR